MPRKNTQKKIGDGILRLLVALPLLLVGASPIYAACPDIDPLNALPVDEACTGWARDGAAETATNLAELQAIINGGAQLFIDYGFIAGAFQDYAGDVEGTPTTLELQIYNQGTVENAEALYNDAESGTGDPVPDWTGTGDARFREAFGMVTFQFWEACCFVSITVLDGGLDAVPHATCMAQEVVQLIQDIVAVAPTAWGSIRTRF